MGAGRGGESSRGTVDFRDAFLAAADFAEDYAFILFFSASWGEKTG
jgi:hypothetical protein